MTCNTQLFEVPLGDSAIAGLVKDIKAAGGHVVKVPALCLLLGSVCMPLIGHPAVLTMTTL